MMQIANPRHDALLAGHNPALLGTGNHRLHIGNAGADRDTGRLRDVRARSRQSHDLLDDLRNKLRHIDAHAAGAGSVGAGQPGILLGDGHSLRRRFGIVRANHRADAVLQRRDDPSPVGVILWIGAEHQTHIQIQPDRISANLHVALFQHIE